MKKLITATVLTFTLAITGSMNHAQAQVIIDHDLTNFGNFSPGFEYGSWVGNVTPGVSFLTIDGTADNSGGGGFFYAPTLDVTTYTLPLTVMSITARLLPTHGGGDLRLVLTSSPLDTAVWSAPASLFNTSTFTTVNIPLSTAPLFTTGTLDYTAVNTFQLQGDYFSPGNFHVELTNMSIFVIPEPGTVATASLLLLGISIFLVRKIQIKKHSVVPA